MGSLFILLVVIGMLLYNVFSWGYVCSVFYKWFILTSFPNLPQFDYVQFIGFMLFIGVLTHKDSVNIKNEYKDEGVGHVQILLGPWLVLLMGWLVKLVFF